VPPKSPLIYEIEIVAISDIPPLPYPKTWWKCYEEENDTTDIVSLSEGTIHSSTSSAAFVSDSMPTAIRR
jgi:hypothetical protein